MPKEHSLSCRKCYSSRVEKSRATGLQVVLIRLFPVQSYRCLFCYTRFLARQESSPHPQRLSSWLILLGVIGLISLSYQWLFVSKNDEQRNQSAADINTTTTEILDQESQRDLVAKLAFNQPDNDFEQEDLLEVPKSELEQKLAAAKTKVESAKAAALLEQQRNAKLAEITAELRSLLKLDIDFMLERWQQAWQQGDSDTYLSMYSTQFKPTGGISLTDWQQQRQLRVVPSKKISLNLSNFEVLLDESNRRSTVSFDQDYQSSTYREKSRKQLILIKEKENDWRIVSEEVL